MKLKNIKTLKWVIISLLIAVMIASIVLVSITERTIFYYAIAVLCPLGSILTIWYIFSQKEDSMPIDGDEIETEEETVEHHINRVTQIIEIEEKEE